MHETNTQTKIFNYLPADRLVLPTVDNLEGVSILGGSTLVNSGGVRLNAESDDSSGNSSEVGGGGGGSNSFLVNPSFRVRSLQSVRYRNDTGGVLQPRQRGYLKVLMFVKDGLVVSMFVEVVGGVSFEKEYGLCQFYEQIWVMSVL